VGYKSTPASAFANEKLYIVLAYGAPVKFATEPMAAECPMTPAGRLLAQQASITIGTADIICDAQILVAYSKAALASSGNVTQVSPIP